MSGRVNKWSHHKYTRQSVLRQPAHTLSPCPSFTLAEVSLASLSSPGLPLVGRGWLGNRKEALFPSSFTTSPQPQSILQPPQHQHSR